MNILFLLQYAFLNGGLLVLFFLQDVRLKSLEGIVLSFILSLSLNSLALYISARAFQWELTLSNAAFVSLTLGGLIAICASMPLQKKCS